MIKKLALLLSLGLAAQAPMMAERNSRREDLDAAAKICAGAVCVAGMAYLVASYPKFFGEFVGALIRGLADRHYCHHCDCHYYGHHHHHHVKVTTYTTYY